MKFNSIISAAFLLAASSEAAVLSPRQRASDCLTGNEAIDSLMSSLPIMSALCLSVMPQTTKVVTVSSSTQVTVIATITDTLMSPVAGSTRTVFVTTTGLTTRTVRVTKAGTGGSVPSATPSAGPTGPEQPSAPITPAPGPSTTSSTIPTASASSSPAPAPPVPATPACDAVGYAGNTAAYQFDGSGLNGNFVNCSALCKADTKCQSFGYGNGACLLFNIPDDGNVNLVAGSPYRFFNRGCSAPIVSRDTNLVERQFGFGGGFGGVGGTIGGSGSVLQQVTEACRCLFGSNLAAVTSTKVIQSGATVTIKSRSTTTIATTVPVTVTRTRQALSTVTTETTIYVQPVAETTPTWEGGVGF